jgi:predicted secreted protein
MGDDVLTVIGRAGEPIDLPVTAGPATGYEWSLDLPEGVARAEDGPPLRPPSDRALGDPAGSALRVVAEPGRHRIVATLARPWARDTPLRRVVIELTAE